jgi:3' exoribonuclease, RNase T-like
MDNSTPQEPPAPAEPQQPPVHVMIDLETLSTKPNALILSVGAAKFYPWGNTIIDSFHGAASLDTFGDTFHIEADTVGFWLSSKQDDARKAWEAMDKNDLGTLLYAFDLWLHGPSNTRAEDPPPIYVWANAPSFDCVILRHAYEKIFGAHATPWNFRNERCFRTLRSQAGELVAPPPEVEPKHTALADAIWQAQYAQAMHRHLFPLV